MRRKSLYRLQSPSSYIKLIFYGCCLGIPWQLGIGGLFTDHSDTLLIKFCKHVETEILGLVEGLKLTKVVGLSNLLVEGDSALSNLW